MLRVASVLFVTFLFYHASLFATAPSKQKIVDMLGQKIMLDLRYFCASGTPSKACQEPVTTLPDDLEALLTSNNIGGVILFSENIKTSEQLIALNSQMQAAMKKAQKPPLFIAIDQEGGRVARFPPSILPAFAGNLAIGATFKKHGTAFSYNVASAIASQLTLHGVNTNFAPSVDINSEPNNPVINVRSFGEAPKHVAKLGEAFVKGLQDNGVISVPKHFPGHGDTSIDSHTGLPRVDHSRKVAMQSDVLPFAELIGSDSPPAMIMTAHIQYPAFDSTQIDDEKGNAYIVPATLSRPIITDLLRGQLGFKGVVVTDALNMAGISHYYTKEDAMLKAFQAGADIALMPYAIRTPDDITAFKQLVSQLAERVSVRSPSEDTLSLSELTLSHQRIIKTKRSFIKPPNNKKALSKGVVRGDAEVVMQESKRLEKALSRESISALYGKTLLPIHRSDSEELSTWLALMPDTARCLAFEKSVATLQSTVQLACIPLTQLPPKQTVHKALKTADKLIVGDITPRHANYELGGIDSAEAIKKRAVLTQVHAFTKEMMQLAQSANKQVVFIALRMPYIADDMRQYADIGLASYSYTVDLHALRQPDYTSPLFNALVNVLTGKAKAFEYTPVTWAKTQ
ncbi:glycoside hydrolase family 3 protein [Alteromonas sp.]|nr:glycoside hydrolase family 3 protein [Alteromonas sp.]